MSNRERAQHVKRLINLIQSKRSNASTKRMAAVEIAVLYAPFDDEAAELFLHMSSFLMGDCNCFGDAALLAMLPESNAVN